MHSTASPRHPWKALVAILAVFAIAHGACATGHSHDHGMHLRVVDDPKSWAGCPDLAIDGDDDDSDGPLIVDDIDDDWT